MGQAKDAWMEEQARGWSDPGGFVCDQCVHDTYLVDLIRAEATERHCDYCGRRASKAIAAPTAVILEPIGRAIHTYYRDPSDAGVPYDEGFIVAPIDTLEVLREIGLDCNEHLLEAVLDAFKGTAWVPAARGHWASSQLSDRMRYSWASFERLVKHKTRYHFADQPAEDYDQLSPAELLVAIGQIVTGLDMVKPLAEGIELHRVRIHHGDWLPGEETMGPPPSRLASAGRMNPAGVSYFYCALERETALGELASTPPIDLAIVEVRLVRDIRVLDLCDLPRELSIFDTGRNDDFQRLEFLRGFTEAISQPVRKDGGEHIDYVPSQVVSEWFAQVFEPGEEGARLEGIMYPSAVVPGGKNLVLFPGRGRAGAPDFSAFDFVSYDLLALSNWIELAEALGFARKAAAASVVKGQKR